ncbi:hypothetical protein NKJ71_09700 [Mesorhizobium sp. M0050]|uniref:hypothetical protein n=1 Tax=Mesorhizobium sp. M0050 TaxID=2956861 RepID=UPI00333C6D32
MSAMSFVRGVLCASFAFSITNASAKTNEIDQIKAALSKAPKQISSELYNNTTEQRRGYFDLVFGSEGCSELEDLIDAAEEETKTNILGLGFGVGKYVVLSNLTLRYTPGGRSEIKVSKVLMQKGTDIENSSADTNATVEPQFCGSTIVKSLRTDQKIELNLKTTGSLAKIDIGAIRALFTNVFETATDVLSVFRPDLAASISLGTRLVEIDGKKKSITDWRASIKSRADAVDRVLKKLTKVIGDKDAGNRNITVESNVKEIVFNLVGGKKLTIRKDFRWSVLVPANEDVGVSGHKFDSDGVTSETELTNSLGADAETLANEVDSSYRSVLKQDDKAVMKLCNKFIRAFGAHLQRHDSLALTWLVVRKAGLQGDAHSRCFDDDQIAELKSYGVIDPPYAGAYGPAH